MIWDHKSIFGLFPKNACYESRSSSTVTNGKTRADSASSATAILNGVKTNDSKKRNIIKDYNVAWVPFRNEFRGLNIPPH